jgi:hydroxyacylglutathione hydrolase
VIQVDYIVNHIFNSRTYILSNIASNDVWLVDCGDFAKVLDIIRGKHVIGVLLTHTHSDHIYGLSDLLKTFPDVLIYTNDYGYGALVSPKLNISKYHSEFDDIIIDDRSNVSVISEGSYMDVLGNKLNIYETPGHDPSCLTFKLDNYLFTGDAFIPRIKVFTSFKGGNKYDAKKSTEKILSLYTSDTKICPGHGEIERAVNIPL